MIKIFYLLLLINLFYLSSCNIKSEEIGKSPIEYSGPQLEVNNLNTSFSDSAMLRFNLKANLYQVFNDGRELYPDGLNMDIYSREKKNITS